MEITNNHFIPNSYSNMRQQKPQFTAGDIQDLTGFVIIVTGGEAALRTLSFVN